MFAPVRTAAAEHKDTPPSSSTASDIPRSYGGSSQGGSSAQPSASSSSSTTTNGGGLVARALTPPPRSPVKLSVQASCVRCHTPHASWTIKDKTIDGSLTASLTTRPRDNTENANLIPTRYKRTYLGPEEVLIFPDATAAHAFLPHTTLKRFGVGQKMTYGLLCGRCGLILGCHPTSPLLGVKGEAVVVYPTSLDMRGGPVQPADGAASPLAAAVATSVDDASSSDVFDTGESKTEDHEEEKEETTTCLSRPRYHDALPLIWTRSQFETMLSMSASAGNPDHPELVILMVGQFWDPASVSAVHRLSDYVHNQRSSLGPRRGCDDDGGRRANGNGGGKDATRNGTNGNGGGGGGGFNGVNCSIVLLDSFGVHGEDAGGVNPADILPSDVALRLRNIRIPCFLFWFRGCPMNVQNMSQHFRCVDGAIVGLDLARYVDIIVPRILEGGRRAFAAAEANARMDGMGGGGGGGASRRGSEGGGEEEEEQFVIAVGTVDVIWTCLEEVPKLEERPVLSMKF